MARHGALAGTGDVSLTRDSITMVLSTAKGRKNLERQEKDVRQVPCRYVPRVAAVLRTFDAGRAELQLRTPSFRPRRRWSLNTVEDLDPAWKADTMSSWLKVAYTAAGHQPPVGVRWTSHSLRKGAASASFAIGVPIGIIRYMGCWSRKSTVPETTYIDYDDTRPTPAAWTFFGHVRKDMTFSDLTARWAVPPVGLVLGNDAPGKVSLGD